MIGTIDEILTGTTTLTQNGPGINHNEELLYIPQSYRTEASLSDAAYCHTLFGGSYNSAEVQSVYFTAPADTVVIY